MEKTGREITQELLSGFCIHLEESGYAKATVNKYKADLMQYILGNTWSSSTGQAAPIPRLRRSMPFLSPLAGST